MVLDVQVYNTGTNWVITCGGNKAIFDESVNNFQLLVLELSQFNLITSLKYKLAAGYCHINSRGE